MNLDNTASVQAGSAAEMPRGTWTLRAPVRWKRRGQKEDQSCSKAKRSITSLGKSSEGQHSQSLANEYPKGTGVSWTGAAGMGPSLILLLTPFLDRAKAIFNGKVGITYLGLYAKMFRRMDKGWASKQDTAAHSSPQPGEDAAFSKRSECAPRRKGLLSPTSKATCRSHLLTLPNVNTALSSLCHEGCRANPLQRNKTSSHQVAEVASWVYCRFYSQLSPITGRDCWIASHSQKLLVIVSYKPRTEPIT